jgi:TnpA family transposase
MSCCGQDRNSSSVATSPARASLTRAHESHFVFYILFNNATDILTAIHSTDTHGANQVNFALLHLFRYRFDPGYRDVRGKVETGPYGFHPPRH